MKMKPAFELLLIFVLLGAFVSYLRITERRLLFYPDRHIDFTPRHIGLDYQEVFLKTSDQVEIFAWFVPCAQAEWTVLICHGNAGNISHRLEKINFFHNLGCNVLIFDYRGYGQSQGKPSEKGFYRDVRSAYSYLVERGVSRERIVGFGESVGGAVIIDLAVEHKLGALIAESTFSDFRDMVRLFYRYLPHWLFSSRFDSLSKVKRIDCPKLFIHSRNDEIVPYELGKKLYESAAMPKEFLEVRGGHNSCFFESEELLKQRVGEFLTGLLGKKDADN
jgi:hypothetical protein